MKHFIATYDIETAPGDPHQRFLEAALAQGWFDSITAAGQTEKLPSSTLVGEFKNLDHAQAAFSEAVEEASRLMSPAQVTVASRYIVQRVPMGRLNIFRRKWVETNIGRLQAMLTIKGSKRSG